MKKLSYATKSNLLIVLVFTCITLATGNPVFLIFALIGVQPFMMKAYKAILMRKLMRKYGKR